MNIREKREAIMNAIYYEADGCGDTRDWGDDDGGVWTRLEKRIDEILEN